MTVYSHAVYIDESGIGGRHRDIQQLWVAAAFVAPFDRKEEIDDAVDYILYRHFREGCTELKGSEMPRRLLKGSGVEDVARDVGNLLGRISPHVYVVGTSRNANPPPGLTVSNPLPKDIVRFLLLERLNISLDKGYDAPYEWLLIWDLSEVQELHDFSRSVATFRNVFTQRPLNPRLAPAVLGGLSHDWTGLQVADIIANLSLHRIGADYGLRGANLQKAEAFDKHVRSHLERDWRGREVGWKLW